MELYQLKTFIAVAEEQQLTKAAVRLCLTQPAVSAQIKQLEDELALPLFKRTPKGMELTPAGEVLKDKAEVVMESVRDLENTAGALCGNLSGKIIAGLNSDFITLKVDKMLTLVQATYPHIELTLNQGVSPEIIKKVKSRHYDIGYIFGECDTAGLEIKKLAEFELSIIGPAAWRDALINEEIHTLSSVPWILPPAWCPIKKAVHAFFQKSAITPDQVITTDNEQALKKLVMLEKGLSIILKKDAFDDALFIYPTKRLTLDLSLIYHKDSISDPVIHAVVDRIIDVWNE